MWSDDNILVFAATAKKGGGINAVLSLLQDLVAFQEKLSVAIEAQDLGENKQKLEQFQERLSEMYESLIDLARGGMQAMRQAPQAEEQPERGNERPPMMNENTIHKI